MFKRLYHWTLSLAESPRATWALAAVAFAESSFFPIPPDTLLVPMSVAKPHKAWHYALICTIASVVGGIVGYGIGYLLFETVGQWLINLYGYGSKMEQVKEAYDKWGALLILVKGVTPIPYKLVTIVSGLLHYNFWLFVLLSAITRGARFFLLAGAMNLFGDKIRHLLEHYFGLFLVLLVVFVIFGFWAAARLV
jgi:membrane protein YqaA with SNARE-associated domain